MAGEDAIDALEAAFATKAGPAGDPRPLAGIFGNGVPLALVAAAGFLPIDVKSAPPAGIGRSEPRVAAYLEPFLDDYAKIFVHRLAAGDFAGLAVVVFPRDDAAALTAYQYATELRRLGVIAAGAPRLILWNLVHGQSGALEDFNGRQAEVLCEALAVAGGAAPTAGMLAAAQADEVRRSAALARLETMLDADAPAISGAEALRWRNGGRYLEAGRHADLIEAACAAVAGRPGRTGRRIGLVGTALDDPRVHEAIEACGTIVCDLQPFGAVWPGPSGCLEAPTPAELVLAEAGDPFAPRARPELAPREAIVARLSAARCDLVVAQYDQNDDTFGWDLPGLRASLEARGIAVVDLGFRDHRPDEGWLAAARARIATAGEDADG